MNRRNTNYNRQFNKNPQNKSGVNRSEVEEVLADETVEETVEETVDEFVARKDLEEIVTDSVEVEVTNTTTQNQDVELYKAPTFEASQTIGYVSGCAKLNVREQPTLDSEVVFILNDNQRVFIELENSTEDFYNMHSRSGVKGFVLKKFIRLTTHTD